MASKQEERRKKIIECSICKGIFDDPRSLPCIHTFCLKCLKTFTRDKMPGDQLPCPLCRTDFDIPQNGVEGLPKNFFMDELIELDAISDPQKGSVCDVCSETPEDHQPAAASASITPATVHCTNCRQNMCENCSKLHKKMKISSGHILVELGCEMKSEARSHVHSRVSYCDQHPDKLMELYCTQCKRPTCLLCYVDAHDSHKCMDVKKVAAVDRAKLESCIRAVTGRVAENESEAQRLQTMKKDLLVKLEIADNQITKRGEDLMKSIRSQMVELKTELSSLKSAKLKEIQSAEEEHIRRRIMMESFIQYSQELVDKGSPCDVITLTEEVSHRADALQLLDPQQIVNGLGSLNVMFRASEMNTTKSDALVGNICVPTISAVSTIKVPTYHAKFNSLFGPTTRTKATSIVDASPIFQDTKCKVAAQQRDASAAAFSIPRNTSFSGADVCVICMDKIENPLRLDCGHVFCEECIAGCFEKHQPKCPSCGLLYGVLRGSQPFGTLRHVTNNWSQLSGYEKYGTIEITYNFPNGTQSDEHPNPGAPYKGTTGTAYLPDSPEGREVLQLLKRAFDARLLFTIDRCLMTNEENVVVWNDIHHKTTPTGPDGYPDPGYLDRVKAELAVKGIISYPTGPTVATRRLQKRNKKK